MTRARHCVGVLVLSLLAMACAKAEQPAAAPSPFLEQMIPRAMDFARRACRATADTLGIAPVAIADLPEPVRLEFEAVFPAEVVDAAKLYLDMPLNDPASGIGLVNTLGMLPMGGFVLGLTFENDVYLYCPLEDVVTNPAVTAIVAHELVHVSQYQALGYQRYKEMYAADAAEHGAYHRITAEYEAFLLQRLYPDRVPPGFFAFLDGRKQDRRVLLRDGGREVLIPAADASNLTFTPVEITAPFEKLGRHSELVLNQPGLSSAPDQIIDPHGGPPLHVFSPPARSTPALLFNGPVHENGPCLVAVRYADGVEVAWRELGGYNSQWIPGDVAFLPNGSGSWKIVQTVASGRRATWLWAERGFVHFPSPTGSRTGRGDTP